MAEMRDLQTRIGDGQSAQGDLMKIVGPRVCFTADILLI